ncbi:MAG: hypothetical protein DI586_10685 [Micavibrio aeruginosavorus]|uniref:MarR family transcriptional regulator n=1 Tax=Micavibrio aeruginosavorus TaxID=349221 RepID=A0A2W5FHE3_9BACT|nr:MAG: hypothetical protein DI586_10685 [Micavibrio aeruginosavorus]
MSIPITTEDREMLKYIHEGGGVLDPYLLHEKFLLSPAQITRLIRKFTVWGIIKEEEGILHLTDKGAEWVFKNRRLVFCQVETYWKRCPKQYQASQLPVGTAYLPDFEALDKDFFKKIIEEDI